MQRLGDVVAGKGLFTPAHGPPVEGARCPQCDGILALGGPLWADELHNQDFLNGLLSSLKRLEASPSSPGKMLCFFSHPKRYAFSLFEESSPINVDFGILDACLSVRG
ncbi:unnamed protein product [Taenia asiatica]|uniref:Uncharacterized protein n=1 Tax=Taenia asiatica TaxID=60517 RepID=A0A3P6PM57_TAEAS|nr:unnamed protein product [Taenia asiatica]